MSNRVITPAGVEHVEEFSAEFRYVDDPNAGFGFPCDAQGNLIGLHEKSDAALDNLLYALTDDGVIYTGIADYSRSFRIGPVVRCDCGAHVQCDGFGHDTDCDRCGREFNSSGQLLAPRSQWGAEWRDQPEEDYGLYPHNPF